MYFGTIPTVSGSHWHDRNGGTAPGRKLMTLGSVAGEIMVTLGLVLVLFVAYQVWWTGIESSREQREVSSELDDRWALENPRPLTRTADGASFARLYVPSFGADFSFAVVRGTTGRDLNRGPGHYVDTQLPGQSGNFAVAGHRVGRGAPFNDLGLLDTCDAVVVETAANWYIYRVLPVDVGRAGDSVQRRQVMGRCLPSDVADRVSGVRYAVVPGREIVAPSDVGVLDPVPHSGVPEVVGDELAMLTLTTCHPRFSNRERMVVHAVLESAEPRVPGVTPEVLGGGE